MAAGTAVPDEGRPVASAFWAGGLWLGRGIMRTRTLGLSFGLQVIAARGALAEDDLGDIRETAPIEARAFERGIGAEHEVGMGCAEAVAQFEFEFDHGERQVELGSGLGRLDAQQLAGALHDQAGASLGDGSHELALHQGISLAQAADRFMLTPGRARFANLQVPPKNLTTVRGIGNVSPNNKSRIFARTQPNLDSV